MDVRNVRDLRNVRDVRDVNVLKKTKDLMLITYLNPMYLYTPNTWFLSVTRIDGYVVSNKKRRDKTGKTDLK